MDSFIIGTLLSSPFYIYLVNKVQPQTLLDISIINTFMLLYLKCDKWISKKIGVKEMPHSTKSFLAGIFLYGALLICHPKLIKYYL